MQMEITTKVSGSMEKWTDKEYIHTEIVKLFIKENGEAAKNKVLVSL